MTTIQMSGAHIRAWLDYNNDGQFDATEQVMTTDGTVHTTTFTPPASAPVLNTPLRLRIISDWVNNPVPASCSQPQYGQVEDYSVTLRDTILARPAALAALGLSVLPNPTTDGRVALRVTGDASAFDGALLSLTVQTVLGQVVARRTLTLREAADATLDLSALPRGIYILTTEGPTPALRGTLRLVRD